VPADLRILDSKSLRIDEALLTGESVASEKTTLTSDIDTPQAEREGMAYMGTLVTFGSARALVTHTGVNTEIGAINRLVQNVTLTQTPLQLQLQRLAAQLTIIILLMTAATMGFGFLVHGSTLAELFQGAIGIAVAAIPEGLPAVVTITLALGVERMAHKRALVRRLPAVEVLGSVDVICSDKTGTLTANAMTVRALVTAEEQYTVTGEGYTPHGEITTDSNDADPELLNSACRIALLCNDANLTCEQDQWLLHGDPTEGALYVLARKHGLTTEDLKQQWPRLDSLPFETEKRYMATLHQSPGSERILAIKGAPDRLIELCDYQQGSAGREPIDKNFWQAHIDQLATQGMRVMALASKSASANHASVDHSHIQDGLTMVALAGINDPPRPEAIDAINECHRAGIRVLMITGDNPATAAAIGRELGLNAERVVTGAELDAMDDQARNSIAESVDIFARTSPTNKLQLVEAMQANRHTVAMTGDGVNDAPALRQADIGVAMGLKGTDAAKEAADFVLTDDNFATITRAVSEGRTLFDNIVKSIAFILPTNLAQASVVAIAILFGWLLPITPAQILWVNMVTAITLALAIAFEQSEANIMLRPPRTRGRGIISARLLYRILLVGGVGAATVITLFNWHLAQHQHLEQARAFAVNTLVMFEIFYLLSARTLADALWHKRYWQGLRPALMAIAVVLLLQLAFTYWGPSQRVFALAPLSLNDWLTIVLATCPIVALVELEKWLTRRLDR
ncbi:MAG TPA: HAD-IC family P-type ATPase, partial [Cellvibrionaceae bacterium]